MNKVTNPLVLIAVGAVAAVLLGIYGFKTMTPPAYQPTPGVAGRPKHDPPPYIQDAINRKKAAMAAAGTPVTSTR